MLLLNGVTSTSKDSGAIAYAKTQLQYALSENA